jgi:hypothetical protein
MAIEIRADHITIDLNGFAILGPADCSVFPCLNAGIGHGIGVFGPWPLLYDIVNYRRFNITIRNGTIQGMGGNGILLVGDSFLIEEMHIRGNGGMGIEFFYDSGESGFANIVQHNIVQGNAGHGIFSTGGLVTDNVASGNQGHGIYQLRGSSARNTAMANGGYGLYLSPFVSFIGNLLQGNGSGESANGINMGQNVCDNGPCPNAYY